MDTNEMRLVLEDELYSRDEESESPYCHDR